MTSLKLSNLEAAVGGASVAFRASIRLQPAGGPGDKVFPPTYAVDDKAPSKYAFEDRIVDGKAVRCVLLDSVASQANRMEEALLGAFERGQLRIPLLTVDFSGEPDVGDIGQISALEAPHRAADAIFRDSLLDGKLFRTTDIGRAITDSKPTSATGLYRYCPTALLFGMWDSTGPKGGLGSKFQRAVVSEIVAIGTAAGTKTASRIDPLGIEKFEGIYKHHDPAQEWTLDEAEAVKEKSKPVLFARSGSEGKGTPSAINHGNIAPSVDTKSGGVTFDHARQTVVLSLPSLRKLRFPTDGHGAAFPAERRGAAEAAGHVVLAALGLVAIALQRDAGYDLRSRAFLVPDGPLVLDEVGRDGDVTAQHRLTSEDALALLDAAITRAEDAGLAWRAGRIALQPAKKFADLIRKSRAQSGS